MIYIYVPEQQFGIPELDYVLDEIFINRLDVEYKTFKHNYPYYQLCNKTLKKKLITPSDFFPKLLNEYFSKDNLPSEKLQKVSLSDVLINDEICFGDCMGQIEINSPTAVTYLLVGNQIINSLSPNFDSLCSGTYMVFAENGFW